MVLPPSPLEPDRPTREKWLAHVSTFVQDQIDRLDSAAASGLSGSAAQAIVESVNLPIEESPLPGGIDEVVERLGAAVQASFNTAGPGYLAYIPGGGIYASALADFIANGLNRYTGITQAAPAFLALEAQVLRWLAAEFGWDHRARGLFLSGGSLANFVAIVTARHHHFGESGDWRHVVAYVSDQIHHSSTKAFRLAGMARANLRVIASDARSRMDTGTLRTAIEADLRQGLKPFLVISSAGTTNTGAVDPLREIGQIAANFRLWHHVDGAYGGAFALCEEGRRRLDGIDCCDSLTFDPHKGLFLPYGTGCLLVRDGLALKAANHLDAEYLQDLDAGHELEIPSPAEYGPELTRSFRGLRLWLPLMLHGAGAFRQALAEKLELAQRFYHGLLARVGNGAAIEVVDEPQLSVVAFRYKRPDGASLAQWNALTQALHAGILRRNRVFLSSTMLPSAQGSIFTTRICVLSFRTHSDRIDMALEDLDATLAEMQKS
jgi:aromatic-L-amino-acid decarboxylase